MIGQGFADEVFRVFAKAHHAITLEASNAHTPVEQMVRHVAQAYAAQGESHGAALCAVQ